MNVKLRNDSSIYDITIDKLEKEKEQMRHLESLEILECIKTSVETLVCLRSEMSEDPSRHVSNKKKENNAKVLVSNSLSESR